MAPLTNMPWERRAEEPEEAYGCFQLYLSLGLGRSLTEAARQCGLSLGRLKQLSSQWQWAARAAMWDRHQFLERRREELESRQQARERLLRESADWQRLARAEFGSWVRRGPEGELELTRELSPYQALRLWRVGCEAELALRGRSEGWLRDPSPTAPGRWWPGRGPERRGRRERCSPPGPTTGCGRR